MQALDIQISSEINKIESTTTLKRKKISSKKDKFTQSIKLIKINKRKKRTKSNKNHITENFCEECNKSYLSYAALYTHKRNKHNVIPITRRPELFKISVHHQKFQYTNTDPMECFNPYEVLKNIKNEYLDLSENLRSNSSTLFFIEDLNLRTKKTKQDSFLRIIDDYISKKNFSLDFPKGEETLKSNVNNVFLVYSYLLLSIVNDNFYFKIVTKFIFFFREYLNIAGWEYKRILMKYNLIDFKNFSEEFCVVNDCSELPDLIDNFISIFIDINGLQPIKKELIDLSSNFCHWLLIKNLTNLKVKSNN